MRAIAKVLTGLLFVVLIGCSAQSTLDTLVSPERQREIVDIGQRFCVSPVGNTNLLHPEIKTSAADAASLLPRECPSGEATWQLVDYSWKTNIENGLKQRQEEAVVVGAGAGKWTTVTLRFYAENDAPFQIVEWNVVGSGTKPEIVSLREAYDAGLKAGSLVIPIALLLLGGLIFWLVRRHRAKKRAAAGPELP